MPGSPAAGQPEGPQLVTFEDIEEKDIGPLTPGTEHMSRASRSIIAGWQTANEVEFRPNVDASSSQP